jgi:hypothetical protein
VPLSPFLDSGAQFAKHRRVGGNALSLMAGKPASARPTGSWCPKRLDVPFCSRKEPDPPLP